MQHEHEELDVLIRRVEPKEELAVIRNRPSLETAKKAYVEAIQDEIAAVQALGEVRGFDLRTGGPNDDELIEAYTHYRVCQETATKAMGDYLHAKNRKDR